MSKTKLGAVLAAVGALFLIVAKFLNGEADLMTALPEVLAVIGTVVAIFGGRDAIAKIGR